MTQIQAGCRLYISTLFYCFYNLQLHTLPHTWFDKKVMARTRHTIGPRLEIPRNGAWAGPQLSDLFCQWNEQAVAGREACTKKCK